MILDSAYTEEDYAICIAKDNTELLEQFNTAIGELKEDGTLQQLLDYYINGVEGAEPYTSPEGITYNGTLTMATNAEAWSWKSRTSPLIPLSPPSSPAKRTSARPA